MKNIDRNLLIPNLLLFICFLFASSGDIIMAKDRNSNDFSFTIGEHNLRLALPNKESKRFIGIETIAEINLDDQRLHTQPHSITALRKYWDFHEGLFRRRKGVLRLQVRIRMVPLGFKGDIKNYAELEKLLKQRMDSSGMATYSSCDLKVLSGKKWISCETNGDYKSIDSVFPLSSSFYIQLQGDFISNTKESDSNWLKTAKEEYRDISESIEIERM